MDYMLLIKTVSEMAVMIGIGVLISRFVTLTAEAKRLMIFLIINIGVPGIIFHGIVQVSIESGMARQILILAGVTLLLHVAFLFIMYYAFKPFSRWVQHAGETAVMCTIGNTGIIGLSICAAMFGPVGALFAALYDIGMTFALWTVSPMLIGEKKSLNARTLRSLLNMPMAAIVAGLVFALSGIPAPSFVVSLSDRIGNLTMPVAMIYLGLLLASNFAQIRAMPKWKLLTPAIGKLILYPLAALLLVFLFQLPPVMGQVMLIMSSVPVATAVPVAFGKYGGDENYAALTSLFTLLVSLVTIPSVVYLGGVWLGV